MSYRAKNTMFWRADAKLAELGRDQRWIDFHRACGRDGLFFDDIDPVNDKPQKDVTDAMRGGGYTAVAVRTAKDSKGFWIQNFVARGKGQDPIAAVIDAYRTAIAAGDPVKAGHEAIFTPEEINIEDLIG